MEYTRITVNPDQLAGAPCIRGLRIPVVRIVYMLSEGMSHEEILEAYPDLECEDIFEALLFAADTVDQQMLPLSA